MERKIEIKKRSFTLVEIVMATVILSVVMLGLVSVFVSAKKIIRHSRARMTAAEAGKLFLERDIQPGSIPEGSWPGEPMGTANGLDRDYNVTYYANTLTGMTNIYRVKAVISWPPEND